MKAAEVLLENDLKTALDSCLAKVPFLRRTIRRGLRGQATLAPDLLVELTLPSGKQTLVVEAKSSGQPRLAREAVNRLLRFREMYPAAYGIFMAPYISPKAAEMLAAEGMGYIDLAGNCRLSFGQVYIEQEGKPNPRPMRRDIRSLYTPKAARILRVLLSEPKVFWKTQALAKEAEVSLGQVANVKKLLGDREWLRSGQDGFGLSQPEAVLGEWSRNYSFRKNQARDFYSLKPVPEIEAGIARECRKLRVRYALTGFSGSSRFAPAVRYQRVMAFVSADTDALASALNLKEVSSGANVTLLTPYDDGVYYGAETVDGMMIASPIQLYLDIVGFKGRGEESAAMLLEKVIKPSW